MALPKYFVLKSNKNNKYLEYVKEDVEVHGLNKFSAENPVSPYIKYEIETAKIGDGLVHIKCCYNNKYLVRWSVNHWWIAAAADEPEEDKSKWSCTLFEFLPMDGAKTIRFRHVELGHYANIHRPNNILYDDCLFADLCNVDKEHRDIFTIIDWESLCILPRHVGFKGENGCYLSLRQVNGNPHLQFESTEIDPAAINEVVTAHDGSVRIMSNQNNKFWRRTSTLDWICADSYDSTSVNPDTVFLPVRVDNKAIALKNLGNNLFCKRFTTRDTTSCLSANSKTICREERLEVKELVTSRYIYNVNYHLKDARIYHQRVLLLASGTVVNRSEEPNTLDVKLAYVDSKSKAWNASVSSKKGVKTDIQASFPVINADGKKVEILDGSNGVFKWGEAIKSSKVSEDVYKVTVPAMTQVKVSLLATKGSCDVPFSYNQLDTLTDGKIVGHTMDDGVYTGFNYYNFKYETKEEKLLAEI